MKRLVGFTLALFVLAVSSVQALQYLGDKEHRQGFELLKTIEASDIIVIGEVTNTEGVWRKEIMRGITTDITVEVETLLKGEPNAGETTVKFMMHGGTATNPENGETVSLFIPDLPTFKVGERMLLFLVKETEEYFDNYAYDKLQPYRVSYGKRPIKKDRVNIAYLNKKERFAYVDYPLDLVVNFAKAFERNKDATRKVEKTIRAIAKKQGEHRVVLNPAMIANLKKRVANIKKIQERRR